MNRMFLPATVVAVAMLTTSIVPLHAEASVAGLWEQSDDDGRVQAWFSFYEKNGVYQGAVAKMFPAPGEKPPTVCAKCPGDQRNAPMIGLVIVNGMQRKGRSYENGTILDPRDGSVYNASMELSPDGQKLRVRGFVGIEWFGQTQTWRRLPDSAMQTPADSTPPSKRSTGSAPSRPQ